MNHLDLNPVTWSRGDLYDAYRDMTTRAGNPATENCLLFTSQYDLEKFIRTLAEKSLDAHGHCLLGECVPVPDRRAGRYFHVAPCRLAQGEDLLSRTVRARLDYGPDSREWPADDAEHVFGAQGHTRIETEGQRGRSTPRRSRG